MASDQPLDDSLLRLIKCSVCLEEVDQLKILLCQHTVCLPCVHTLSTREHWFKCSTCNKEHPVPNGGFEQLPDSLLTKQIADLVRQRRGTENSKISDADDNELDQAKVTSKDLDLSQFREELDEAIDAGKRWHKKAKETIKEQSAILEHIPESCQHTKDTITVYRETTVLKCQQKLQGVNKCLSDQNEELKERVDSLKPATDKLSDTMKGVPAMIQRLSAKDCSSEVISEAQQLLKSLTGMNREMKTSKYDLDKEHGDITVGDSVRLQYFDNEDEVEEFVNGKVSNSSVGIFVGIRITQRQHPIFPHMNFEKETPLVIFPEKHNWEGPNLESVTKSYTKAQMPFVGDRVRVKGSVTNPHFAWRGVRAKKSRGVLKKIEHDAQAPEDDLVVVIDFPEEKGWKGLYSEIELLPGCGFEVGDTVRVSSAIPEPSRGWAGVDGSSVGTVKVVKSLKGQEEITVDFPECKNWIGLPTDIEMTRTLTVGDLVQVKLSVKTPELGWGDVSHEDVGTYSGLMHGRGLGGSVAQVRFPNRANAWSCKLKELEPARYQPPDYGPASTDEVDEEFQAAVFMRMMQLMGGRW